MKSAQELHDETTVRGIKPTITVGETYAPPPTSKVSDLFALFKPRVTSLIVLTAWAGYFMAARKFNLPQGGWRLAWVLTGVALVAAGAAALNQVMEWRADGRMNRTRNRPLPTHRMKISLASAIGTLCGVGGSAMIAYMSNPLAAAMSLITALSYVFIYTPLKMRSPVSTFVGAFPGAMPVVLGWTAVSGRLDWEALALFAIVFFWQFPHFHAIAWLYREDYERAGIRMLAVIRPDGEGTIRRILGYGAALIPISLLPAYLGMSGRIYFAGAILLGITYLSFGVRLAMLKLPATSAQSKKEARQLLQASVVYLPLLFALMMMNGAN